MHISKRQLLRAAFLVGAITDAAALIPMLSPQAARLLWGIEPTSGAYRFAMMYGASLMLGWTVLLAWAYQKPMERRFVTVLTIVVVYGLVLSEVVAAATGEITIERLAPTWALQAAVILLFALAYHYPADPPLERHAARGSIGAGHG